MNICIVCGARPNFIKVAPVIRAISSAKAQGHDIDYRLVYTGSADDPTVEPTIFADLQIDKPDEYLDVTCSNLNELTGQVMSKFEQYLHRYPTDTVIVVDDLASTMAAAIVTKKQGVRLAHIAAGTRSFDITMPKEINRLVIDGLSDILFTAGISNNSIANREGAELSKVYMVGNVLIDNLRFFAARRDSCATAQLPFALPERYLVFTLNRKQLIADRTKLCGLLEAIVRSAGDVPVYAPLHGVAHETVAECLKTIGGTAAFHMVGPVPYLAFENMLAKAAGIITDSGNVAEEATFDQVPCITLNSYTEHIETVKVGTNVLVGEDSALLAQEVARMVAGQWKEGGIPDRWDGRSAERIVQILMEHE